ncbi:homocitrate synthase [Trichoderma cornu-damae]|uniref:Homocitrate synthase n=1 Tax=Trichoderma cornu-damae TaxID=654480 RepID=A0A9P8QPC2_9HYPO|nr:homocitrate synthase [Trichoderma cornu-damae]
MPLHLLGKKSWNVYNADNIARVRRDEAAAKAAEQEEERRMQEIDAERRLAILRGEEPPPIADGADVDSEKTRDISSDVRSKFPGRSHRGQRKRPGEDDTEFELRLAKERNDGTTYAIAESRRKPASGAPIVDHAGHIDLFGDERARAQAEKNEEAEAEKRKKEREYEDQYTMRFANAAGKDGISQPWYSQREGVAPDASSKDVWGNNDPRRKTRDAQRIHSSDPLAMMKMGASQIRELKRERMAIQQERDEELRELRNERRGERHRERHREREGREGRGHPDSKRRDAIRMRSKERDAEMREHRDDRRERRRHKEQRRRRRDGGSRSRSRSPNRRLHRRPRDER